MAPTLSKLTPIPLNCTEVLHPWTSSCSKASFTLFWSIFREGFKIYSFGYLLSLLASRKVPKKKEEYLSLLLNLGRSALFLGLNGFLFYQFACRFRKLFGHFNYFTFAFIPVFIGSFLSIQVEKASRRPLLAIYVTNVATETVYRMLKYRGIIKEVKHFEIALFVLSSAAIFYQMKKRSLDSIKNKLNYKKDFIDAIFSKIVGSEEFPSYNSTEIQAQNQKETAAGRNRSSRHKVRVKGGRRFINPFILIQKIINRQIDRLASNFGPGLQISHELCPHKPKPCFKYWIQGFISRFGTAFSLQLLFQLIVLLRSSNLKLDKSKRRDILEKCLKSGLSVSSMSFGFRTLSCLFRWKTGEDSPRNALLSSILGSWIAFLLIRPPSSIGLYLFFKGLIMILQDAHKENNFWIINQIDKIWGGGWTILFGFSTAILIHVGLLEPHNLKPSYFRFLNQVCGRVFQDVNRHILTLYGTDSNKMILRGNPTGEFWWPKTKVENMSEQMKEIVKHKNQLFAKYHFANNLEKWDALKEIIKKVLF